MNPAKLCSGTQLTWVSWILEPRTQLYEFCCFDNEPMETQLKLGFLIVLMNQLSWVSWVLELT